MGGPRFPFVNKENTMSQHAVMVFLTIVSIAALILSLQLTLRPNVTEKQMYIADPPSNKRQVIRQEDIRDGSQDASFNSIVVDQEPHRANEVSTKAYVDKLITGVGSYRYRRVEATTTLDGKHDLIGVDTSTAVTLTLPSASSQHKLTIADVTGNASIRPITIQAAGNDTIVGESSIEIQIDYNSQNFTSDGNSTWILH